jgi:hypothetical protein
MVMGISIFRQYKFLLKEKAFEREREFKCLHEGVFGDVNFYEDYLCYAFFVNLHAL